MASAFDNLRKVDHIVVLMMENRSFDHMLGGFLRLDQGRAEIDGPDAAAFNEWQGRQFPVHRASGTRLVKAQDPCHSGACVDAQVAGGMAGFAANYARTRTSASAGDTPATVMAYHTVTQLSVYAFLAEQFAVCDRWFCSVPGATMPNRCYAIAGRAQGSRDNISPPLYHLQSFVRHLDAAGVSWRWYSHDDVPMLWFVDQSYAVGHPSRPAYFDRQGLLGRRSFLQDAAAGSLPAVSWVDPNFVDVSFGPEGSNDDHPPSDLRGGQDLVLKLFHAVMRGPKWSRTLVVITYDEHGGFFDHVEPVQAADDDPAFRRYGPRVPALVVSPWVEQRQVSHLTFDHTSIIKTILLRFCRQADGSIPNMGRRVQAANHLGELLGRERARPRIAQQRYQHLIEEMAAYHAELLKRGLELQTLGPEALEPDLTDFQQDYLAGRDALLALQQQAGTAPPPPPPT